jgi:S1-C subfamily serine protease
MKKIAMVTSLSSIVLAGALGFQALAQSGRVKVQSPDYPLVEILTPQPGNSGYLGVYLGDVTEKRLTELKLSELSGAIIGQVVAGSPADKAGLRENDVILRFNAEAVRSARHLYRLLTETPPGRTINLVISRQGTQQNLQVMLGERPAGWSGEMNQGTDESLLYRRQADELRRRAEELRKKFDREGLKKDLDESEETKRQAEELRRFADEMRSDTEKQMRERFLTAPRSYGFITRPEAFRLGVRVTRLSPQLAEFFHVPEKKGLLVNEVEAGSVAAKAGLQAGDCIIAVNGEKVESEADLRRLISSVADDDGKKTVISLEIVRERKTQMLRGEK